MTYSAANAEKPDVQIADLQARMAATQAENTDLHGTVQSLQAQLDWFKRELFGSKSEKRPEMSPEQLALFESLLDGLPEPPPKKTDIAAHTRTTKRTGDEVNDTGLRFTDDVPIEVVEQSCPELDGPDADQYEVIAHKESYRLASEPGTSVVICYRRPVVKRKDSGKITQPAAPVGPLGHAQADTSFLSQMLIDKFVYHMPLYRQHQKLGNEGITLSRATLDNWTHSAIMLLKPIADAVMEGILAGGHIKVDETPVKAGRGKKKNGQGKMKQGWFWPILGEEDDIAFHFSPSRGARVLKDLLEGKFEGVAQTDGYVVYKLYFGNDPNITHALCWAHTRREFLKAEVSEPQAAGEILTMIKALYAIEKQLRKDGASDKEILESRERRSEPILNQIFAWIKEQQHNPGLLPKSPLAKALNYAAKREAGLRVFIEDAWLALDTNDIERGLRVIPMGKKNWLFCSSEVGAEHVAIIQTLLATCRAHGVNPFNYLVDVLQRVDRHPASRVGELTPREWKERFGGDPLRSPLYEIRSRHK